MNDIGHSTHFADPSLGWRPLPIGLRDGQKWVSSGACSAAERERVRVYMLFAARCRQEFTQLYGAARSVTYRLLPADGRIPGPGYSSVRRVK